MISNEKEQPKLKPLIIANPVYGTVFKRLMENMDIVKFLLSAILGQRVTAVDVFSQKFIRNEKDDEKENRLLPYLLYRNNFMATVLTGEGEYRKILIEIQNSLGTMDILRFDRYLKMDYTKKVTVITDNDSRKLTLPTITVYILGSKLTEIKCSCLKVGRTYTDIITDKPVTRMDDFIEQLPRNSYIIKSDIITDNRDNTVPEKLISIFEQSHFYKNSEAVKIYRYLPPDDGDINLITKTLHEMGVDPEECEKIENEVEYVRTIDDTYGAQIREQDRALLEKDKVIAEIKKENEEKDRALLEKNKAIEENRKENEESRKEIKEQNKKFEEQEKKFEDQAKKIAEIERLLQNKQ